MMHHRLAVLGAVTFAGFLSASYIGGVPALVCFALCGIAALLLLILTKRRKAAFVLTGLAASFFIFGTYSLIRIEPVSSLYGCTCEMTAQVESVGLPDNDTLYITASGSANGIPVKFSFYSPDIGTKRGDTLRLTAVFSEPRVTASYNGNYSYSRGIFVRAAAKDADILRSAEGADFIGAVTSYSEMLRDIVKEHLSGDTLGLMLGMCFGDKSGMDADLADAVARSGLSHMTAVSGMHISLIVTALAAFLDLLGTKNRRFIRFGAIAAMTAVFVVFFGMTASVCRSAVMLIMYYAAGLFRRSSSSADSLGAAVLIILFAEPCACRDTGLVLSVCGTIGAGIAAPKVCTLLRGHITVTPAVEAFTVSVCASYCTLPVSAFTFGRISLISPITSIIVYPIFFAVMLTAVIFAFTGGIFASFLLLPAGLLLKLASFIIRFFAGFRYSCIGIDSDRLLPFAAVTAVFLAVFALLAYRLRRNRGRAVLSALAACVCVFAGIVTADKVLHTDETKLTVFSDGHDFLVSVSNDAGISAFASDVNSRISSAAYDALAERGGLRFDLLCVMSEKKRGSMHSDAFESLKALEKRYLDNTEKLYDISGRFTAEINEDAVFLDINGVGVLLADAASSAVYGGQDIAVYSGYKKSADPRINGITVFCDKRYSDTALAYNAYYTEICIRISRDGKILKD